MDHKRITNPKSFGIVTWDFSPKHFLDDHDHTCYANRFLSQNAGVRTRRLMPSISEDDPPSGIDVDVGAGVVVASELSY